MLGNVSTAELLIILAVLIGIFGKKKTSEIARDAGEASRELRKVRREAIEAVEELRKMEEAEPKAPEEKKAEKKEEAPEPTAEQLDKEMIEIARSKKNNEPKGGEKVA